VDLSACHQKINRPDYAKNKSKTVLSFTSAILQLHRRAIDGLLAYGLPPAKRVPIERREDS
jgi:hypothetical protein